MKKTIAIILALLMSLSAFGAFSAFAAEADPFAGAGTAADPYKISTAADLDAFAAMTGTFTEGMYFVLTNDIDYTDYKAGGEAPAKSWAAPEYFLGTFDGQGHTISGLYFSDPSRKTLGMGFIASTGKDSTAPVVIKNVNINDSYFEVQQHVGAVLGKVHGDGLCDVTISGCSSNATVKASGTSYAGGIVGFSSNVKVSLTIENCLFAGNIEAGACVGGIAGQIGTSSASKVEKQAYVKNCLNIGTIAGSRIVAGIVGRDYYGCTVTDCVNTGTITANTDNEKYPSQFGTVVSYDNTQNKDSYYLASNPAKQLSFADAESCADKFHKAVDSFTAANCPTLSADYWVFNADGSIMLKTFAPASEPEVTEPPVVTEPETTEAPAATEPETTEPPVSGETGDSALIFAVIAVISVFGVAVIAKKREN